MGRELHLQIEYHYPSFTAKTMALVTIRTTVTTVELVTQMLVINTGYGVGERTQNITSAFFLQGTKTILTTIMLPEKIVEKVCWKIP
jgi:hypothetical protein